MNEKVSVIIPVYNAEHTVQKCVESIVYGQVRNIEIILIDDCSKDASWEICKQLHEKYSQIVCVQNSQNSGVSYTRNQGLKYASGKYVLFVDSDDWVSGSYVKKMLETVESVDEALIVCGYSYINQLTGENVKFVWDNSSIGLSYIFKDQFFELNEKILLQQLWNKIFHRNIIEKANICFDETQSMGEDFQFVLDYMKAANLEYCVMINEPLYYYVRANSSSLMSKFGLSQFDNAFKRYYQLKQLCGNKYDNIEIQYKKAVSNLQQNFLYQIMNSSENKNNKLRYIESVMQGQKAATYYRKQQVRRLKEIILQVISQSRQIAPRIQGKIQRSRRERLIKNVQKNLSNKENFTIISQNCIGGVFYHDMGMRFLSPTINLFIWQPDFIRMVMNLEHYMSSELEMYWDEKYPIGILGGDVKIGFMHYQSCSEAKKSWEDRVHRINYDNIVVVSTDRNGFTAECFEEWKKIPYPKVLFTTNKAYADEQGSVYLSQYKNDKVVPDLIPDREFYKDGVLLSVINNLSLRK